MRSIIDLLMAGPGGLRTASRHLPLAHRMERLGPQGQGRTMRRKKPSITDGTMEKPMQWYDLPTPALAINLCVLDHNIDAMARFARDHGLALRPHAKTHKSVRIAGRQIGAGAAGICCAKLGEAEAMIHGGIDSILVTSPVVSAEAIRRLAQLHAMATDLAVVVDHPLMVARLAEAATPQKPLRVLVDVDPGMKRTGVASASAAVDLARLIVAAPTLDYGGVQFYCGLEQHIPRLAARRAAIEARTNYLREVICALRDAGHAPPVVTGGGTGTHRIDAELGVLTEIQPGSYVFMDEQYLACEVDGTDAQFGRSLAVHATVISANHPGLVTVDAGTKALSIDGPAPTVLSGSPQGTLYRFMGDEHGVLELPEGRPGPALRDRVILGVPHCDPTVNLHDVYHVWDEGQWMTWPIEARGRSD